MTLMAGEGLDSLNMTTLMNLSFMILSSLLGKDMNMNLLIHSHILFRVMVFFFFVASMFLNLWASALYSYSCADIEAPLPWGPWQLPKLDQLGLSVISPELSIFVPAKENKHIYPLSRFYRDTLSPGLRVFLDVTGEWSRPCVEERRCDAGCNHMTLGWTSLRKVIILLTAFLHLREMK